MTDKKDTKEEPRQLILNKSIIEMFNDRRLEFSRNHPEGLNLSTGTVLPQIDYMLLLLGEREISRSIYNKQVKRYVNVCPCCLRPYPNRIEAPEEEVVEVE
jgi:hypothetical protein